MNHLTKVKYIQKLNEEELKRGIAVNASWHTKYNDSAYIYIGGFPYELTEGDLVIVFSQYGEVVDCRIVRDKETGKSKGFGFICYEDQRSTILAVDNLNGANISGRVIRVDHVEQYKIPKEHFDVEETDEAGEKTIYKPSGPDGRGWGEDRILLSEDVKFFEDLKQLETERESRMNIVDESKYIMDQDERWEQEFVNLIESKKETEKLMKQERAEKRRKKKEKKEKKKAKEKGKEEKKKQTESEKLKEIYKSYGINADDKNV